MKTIVAAALVCLAIALALPLLLAPGAAPEELLRLSSSYCLTSFF